jgi:hypothetical protein
MATTTKRAAQFRAQSAQNQRGPSNKNLQPTRRPVGDQHARVAGVVSSNLKGPTKR